MSQSARDTILNRLRHAASAEAQQQSAKQINEAANALLENSPHAPLAGEEPVTAFMNRINAGKVIGTSCSRLQSIAQLPAAVSTYLQDNQLGPDVGVQALPVFADLDWGDINNTGELMEGEQDGMVAVSYADYGIAETSSVVFHSGEHRPVLLNFWPLHLMIVVPADKIIMLLDDYALHAETENPPSKTVWITGASGTSDIEGVLVQGAHGPCQVHIFIV